MQNLIVRNREGTSEVCLLIFFNVYVLFHYRSKVLYLGDYVVFPPYLSETHGATSVKIEVWYFFISSGIQQWRLDSDATHPSLQKKDELDGLQNMPRIKVRIQIIIIIFIGSCVFCATLNRYAGRHVYRHSADISIKTCRSIY